MRFERRGPTYGLRRERIGSSFVNTILTVLIIIVLAGGVYFYLKGNANASFNGAYQAVFLDNDQVYFGKITKNGKEIVELEDVYYLQANNSALLTNSAEASDDSFALVKLGNELHQPETTMYIYRAHILYIENLTPDSRIVRAIEAFQAE